MQVAVPTDHPLGLLEGTLQNGPQQCGVIQEAVIIMEMGETVKQTGIPRLGMVTAVTRARDRVQDRTNKRLGGDLYPQLGMFATLLPKTRGNRAGLVM